MKGDSIALSRTSPRKTLNTHLLTLKPKLHPADSSLSHTRVLRAHLDLHRRSTVKQPVRLGKYPLPRGCYPRTPSTRVIILQTHLPGGCFNLLLTTPPHLLYLSHPHPRPIKTSNIHRSHRTRQYRLYHLTLPGHHKARPAHQLRLSRPRVYLLKQNCHPRAQW